MPTTVTKSIGTTGRDYSDWQTFFDAMPASLVAVDEAWVGEGYNDSEFALGTVLTLSGHTTDATRNITLTCGAGQSFRDNANKLTNALRYNASNGVAIRNNVTQYFPTLEIQTDFVTLTGLQIQGHPTSRPDNKAILNDQAAGSCVMQDCILESWSGGLEAVRWRSGTIRNCLIVQRASDANSNGLGFGYPGTIVCVNNTIVCPSDLTAGESAVTAANGTTTITNCAMFGFAATANVDSRFTGSNNAADVTIGFGSSNQSGKTYANQFQDTADATRDFRLKTGADCIDNGVTDTTNGTPDIVGTARPQGSAYDIGAWELASSLRKFILH